MRAVAPAARGRLARAQDHLDGVAGGRRGVSLQHDVHASPQDAALWDQTAGPCECEEECRALLEQCIAAKMRLLHYNLQAAGCTASNGALSYLGCSTASAVVKMNHRKVIFGVRTAPLHAALLAEKAAGCS